MPTSATKRRSVVGALLVGAMAVAFRLFRRKRRVIDAGAVSQRWLAAERGTRQDNG